MTNQSLTFVQAHSLEVMKCERDVKHCHQHSGGVCGRLNSDELQQGWKQLMTYSLLETH